MSRAARKSDPSRDREGAGSATISTGFESRSRPLPYGRGSVWLRPNASLGQYRIDKELNVFAVIQRVSVHVGDLTV